MVKKTRGNAEYFKATNQAKKENTVNLIREAVLLMNETNEILDIKAVSQKTKELDPDGKGVSEATFRKKDLVHIQTLMHEHRIGKYAKIKVGAIGENIADQILELQKENKKIEKILTEYKITLKNTKNKLEHLVLENEELRGKVYEMEMNEKINQKLKIANNLS